MPNFNNASFVLTFLIAACALSLNDAHNLKYEDLETMGVSCPARDKCKGYANNVRDYMNRSCECDHQCTAYRDCCIDATASASTPKSNVECLHYGEYAHTGVFVISKCRSNWNGSTEVRQKCVAGLNMSDPLSSVPVTDTARSVTYRNIFCAECNDANLTSLTAFGFGLSCDSLPDLSEEQILGEITYNRELNTWGIYRLNSDDGETHFLMCDIDYDVPGYLNSSVRFCRSNLISTCASDWSRHVVRRACEAYTTVVYDKQVAYRNPHCAICNHKTVDDISCNSDILGRKKPMSFALLLDVNQRDGDQVGMRRVATPECPSGHKYDPFFKKCRQLVCALPGFVVVNGQCVRG